MTAALHCHCCGKSLKAYAVTIQTAAGLLGYGPKCGREMALKITSNADHIAGMVLVDERDRLRKMVRAKGWDGRRIRTRPRAQTVTRQRARREDDRQLTLQLT